MDLSDLKELQNIEIEMLSEINVIADNNSLNYILAYGSMLGAVREKGIIEWDADIDICVDVDQYQEFCECLKRFLPEKYTVIDTNNVDYELLFSRVILKDHDHHIIHVDIFPLAGAPKNKMKKRAFAAFAKLLFNSYYVKKIKLSRVNHVAQVAISKALLFLVPSSFIRMLYKYVSHMYPISVEGEVFCMINEGMIQYIPTLWYKEKLHWEFNGLYVPISRFYDRYLKHFYGDYMTPRKENYYAKYKG